MENLSLVIKCNSEKIYQYIGELEILVDDFNTEIIIINNELERLNIPYNHVFYKYEESYARLEDFCDSVCAKENIIIIEEGMIIDKETLEGIKSRISTISKSLYCNVKRYLTTDRSKYVISKLKISKNITNDEIEDMDNIIEDVSLLQSTDESMDKGITLLCDSNNYNELFIWYTEHILNCNINSIHGFYELLEKRKLDADSKEVILIEKVFLDSKEKNKYVRYLSIKNNFYIGDGSLNTSFIKEVINLDLHTEDKFFCYFLLMLVKNNGIFTELCKAIEPKILESYFEYLFIQNKKFDLYVYKYLIAIHLEDEISKKSNSNIKLYSSICKYYIQYMSDKSENFESKQRLIQVFIDYTNYGFYVAGKQYGSNKKGFLTTESRFLLEIDKAISMINKNKLDEAIKILKNATSIFPIMSRPVEYYMQRLRYENSNYPYKISICMIVKDEEKNIVRCLQSLKPMVDCGIAELVIVDTGSTDKTVELAERFVKKVYFHEWQGSFSEARNYSISLAQGEYIFIMDADEEIEDTEMTKLISVFNSSDYKEYNAFSFKIKNYSDEKSEKFSIFTQNLIFKNDGTFYYSGSVHNQPIYKLPVKHIDCTVLHYGYIMTTDIKDKKFNRTATLLKKELEKSPENIYYRFQLSVSYSMHGDLKESLEQAKIYMKLLKDKDAKVIDSLMYYNNAALVYSNNHLYNEAIEISNEALAAQPDFIDFIYYKGNSYFEKKEYSEAIVCLKEYLELLDEFHKHDVMHDDRYLFYTLDSKEIAKGMLTVSYYKASHFKKCIEQIKYVSDNKIFKNIIYAVVDSFLKERRFDELVKFFEFKIYGNPEKDIKEVFKYYLEEYLKDVSDEDQKKCILSFAKSNLPDEYIDIYKFRAGNNVVQNTNRTLNFIGKYDINETDSVSSNMIIETILPIVLDYKYNQDTDVNVIRSLKIGTEFILHRSMNLKQYNNLDKEVLIQLLDKYIGVCSHLIYIGREDFLEANEISFISNVLNALEELNKNNFIGCITYIRDSVLVHKKMAKPMELFLSTFIPGYSLNNSI